MLRLLFSRVLPALLTACLLSGGGAWGQGRQIARISESAAGSDRVALVIGNASYKRYRPLDNPVNDARLMAGALKSLGFELIGDGSQENLDKRGLDTVIRNFGESIRGKSVAFLFYSGHGGQESGRNYLIPIDADITSPQQIKYQLVDVDFVLDDMKGAGIPLNIIILDACRTNILNNISGEGKAAGDSPVGLAGMRAPRGTLIAFATAPGTIALDGAGRRNSPYTEALARFITEPGLRIEDVFMKVGDEVEKKTGGKQVPWKNDSLRGVFYLRPSGGPGGGEPPVRLAGGNPEGEAPPPKPSGPKPGEVWKEPATGMEFVWVPGGSYLMGCGSWTSECFDSEKPVHEVSLKGFWIGKTEVTQGQWKAVTGGNRSDFKKGGDYPVEMVSWNDAQGFIEQLNRLNGGSSRFRLPTEAEWEYAARSGGKPEKYAGGNEPDRVAWYGSNSGGSTHPVGAKAPNALGIYDMSGNVYEWCMDIYASDAYRKHSRDNPIYADNSGGSLRVLRGGSWLFGPQFVRCAYRLDYAPAYRDGYVGFRLVRTP